MSQHELYLGEKSFESISGSAFPLPELIIILHIETNEDRVKSLLRLESLMKISFCGQIFLIRKEKHQLRFKMFSYKSVKTKSKSDDENLNGQLNITKTNVVSELEHLKFILKVMVSEVKLLVIMLLEEKQFLVVMESLVAVGPIAVVLAARQLLEARLLQRFTKDQQPK